MSNCGIPSRPWQRFGLDDRAAAAVAAIALVLILVVVVVVRSVGGPKAEDAVSGYAAALRAGDLDAAATFTNGDPPLVADMLQANIDGLDGATVDAEVEEVTESGDGADAKIRMSWEVPEIGAFEYTSDDIHLTLADGTWLIDWSSRVIYPGLREDGQRLGTTKAFGERAPILDTNGNELVTTQPVVDVAVDPSKVDDPAATAEAIAAVTEADPKALVKAIEGADPDSVVPAITLRRRRLRPVRDRTARRAGYSALRPERAPGTHPRLCSRGPRDGWAGHGGAG